MFERIKKIVHTESKLDLSLSYQGNFAFGLGLVVLLTTLLYIWSHPMGNWVSKLSDAAVCGLVAALVFGINLSFLPTIWPQFFNPLRWTIGKDILFTSWIFFFVGTINLLLLKYLGWADFRWSAFFVQQLVVMVLGVPPVTALVVIRNKEFKQQFLRQAASLNQQLEQRPILLPGSQDKKALSRQGNLLPAALPPTLKLKGTAGKSLEFPAQQLLALHSQKGQLHVFWWDGQQAAHEILALRLKDIAPQVAEFDKFILRCHRFYWVNSKMVEKVESSVRGISLKVQQLVKSIPVSKTYTKEIEKVFADA